ncbi:MAG: hypothetical protein IJM42_00320, partial [Synergistes sp.]|nr:hypothetical protein [Synergistes sp.]
TGASVYSSAAAAGDSIFIGSCSDYLYQLSAADGRVLRSIPLDGDVTTAPVVTQNGVITVTTGGSIYSIR